MNAPRLRMWIAALAICAGLAIAGCGDDKLSESDLVKQADEVCKQINVKTQAIPAPANVKAAATSIGRTIAILEPAEAKLRALKPPDSLKDEYNAWVAKTEQIVATAKAAQAAAKKNDRKQFNKEIQKGIVLNQQTNDLAGQVGLKVCSAGSA